MAAKRLKVLFLCTGNSCRSQMAEAWANHLKGSKIEAFSAGIVPRNVDPRAVLVMKEAGVDISGARSKHIDEFLDSSPDYVITVCDNTKEMCPVFPGKIQRVHVNFDDPPRLAQGASSEKHALDLYRRVRDEIRAFVEKMPANLKKLAH